MAITATLRLAGDRQGKSVPAVADRTGALRSIGVEASDAFVWPGRRVQFSFSKNLHFAAVAFFAAHGSSRRAFHVFAEHIVERTENLSGLRVMAGLEFVSLLGMACAARLWRDHHRYAVAVMIECVRPCLVGLVTFVAADADLCVAAGSPLLHGQRRSPGLVAGNTRLTFFRGIGCGLGNVRDVLSGGGVQEKHKNKCKGG